eukprot:1139582-Pelagomonas_calceolata.AAC.2
MSAPINANALTCVYERGSCSMWEVKAWVAPMRKFAIAHAAQTHLLVLHDGDFDLDDTICLCHFFNYPRRGRCHGDASAASEHSAFSSPFLRE